MAKSFEKDSKLWSVSSTSSWPGSFALIEVIHLQLESNRCHTAWKAFENVIDLDWTQVIGAQVAHGMKLWMSLHLFNWKTTRLTSTNALLLCSWIRWSKKCNAASKITLQCHKNLSDWKHSPQIHRNWYYCADHLIKRQNQLNRYVTGAIPMRPLEGVLKFQWLQRNIFCHYHKFSINYSIFS